MKKSFKRLLTVISAMALTMSSLGVTQAATADQNLLNTYGAKYGRSGTCVNLYQLQNPSTLNTIKQRYNSITLENEMKPDAMLGNSPTLISVAEAKSLGYYIPSNYTEATVPKINFGTMDKVLKIAYDNGLGVRGHTLVWHGQTPSWLFRTGYNGGAGYVNQSVMNARMEFYIKTVMNHAYNSQYGSVVYAWDVVNEYLHSPANSDWLKIYGNVSTSPQFVKDAFRYASETLSYYKLTDKVSLFYNDFNEYMEADNIVKMINFINAEKKICNGVGGQAHLESTFPSASYFKQSYSKFVNAGFEIQITEFDAGAKSEQEQATYVYDVMKSVNELKKAGGKITGFTWWGLSDDVSWRRDKNPLLHSNLNTPKASYYRTLDAYTDVFNR